MIKIGGEMGFTLGFEVTLDLTESQWDSLRESEQMELIVQRFSRSDYENLETDGIDVWDLEECEEEEAS